MRTPLKVIALCGVLCSFLLLVHSTSANAGYPSLYSCIDWECEEWISKGKTLLRYIGRTEKHLSFKKNEDILIVGKPVDQKSSDWIGKVGNKVGLVPKDMVREDKMSKTFPKFKVELQDIPAWSRNEEQIEQEDDEADAEAQAEEDAASAEGIEIEDIGENIVVSSQESIQPSEPAAAVEQTIESTSEAIQTPPEPSPVVADSSIPTPTSSITEDLQTADPDAGISEEEQNPPPLEEPPKPEIDTVIVNEELALPVQEIDDGISSDPVVDSVNLQPSTDTVLQGTSTVEYLPETPKTDEQKPTDDITPRIPETVSLDSIASIQNTMLGDAAVTSQVDSLSASKVAESSVAEEETQFTTPVEEQTTDVEPTIRSEVRMESEVNVEEGSTLLPGKVETIDPEKPPETMKMESEVPHPEVVPVEETIEESNPAKDQEETETSTSSIVNDESPSSEDIREENGDASHVEETSTTPEPTTEPEVTDLPLDSTNEQNTDETTSSVPPQEEGSILDAFFAPNDDIKEAKEDTAQVNVEETPQEDPPEENTPEPEVPPEDQTLPSEFSATQTEANVEEPVTESLKIPLVSDSGAEVEHHTTATTDAVAQEETPSTTELPKLNIEQQQPEEKTDEQSYVKPFPNFPPAPQEPPTFNFEEPPTTGRPEEQVVPEQVANQQVVDEPPAEKPYEESLFVPPQPPTVAPQVAPVEETTDKPEVEQPVVTEPSHDHDHVHHEEPTQESDHHHHHHHHHHKHSIFRDTNDTETSSIILVIKHISSTLLSFLPEPLQDTILDVDDALVLTGIIALTLVSICVPYFFIEGYMSVRPLKKKVVELNKSLWKVSAAYETQQEEFEIFKQKAIAHDEFKKRAEQSENDVVILKKLETKHREQITTLKTQLKNQMKEAVDIRALIEKTLEAKKQVVEECEKYKAAYENAKESLAAAKDELNSIQTQAKSSALLLNVSGKNLEVLNSKVAMLEQEAEEMKAQLAAENEKRKGIEIEKLETEQAKVKVEKELADFKAICHQYETTVSDLNDEISRLESELVTIKESLGEDSPFLEAAEIQVKAAFAEREAKSLRTRLDGLTADNDNLSGKLKEISSAFDEAKAEKEKTHNRLQVLEKYFKEREEEYIKTIEQLQLKESVRDKGKEELIKIIEEKDSVVNDINERLEALKEEFEETKQQHRNEIRALEAKGHENWLSLCQAERKAQDARKEAKMLRQQLTTLTKERDDDGDGLNGEVPMFPVLPDELVPLPIDEPSSFFGLGGDFVPPPPLPEGGEREPHRPPPLGGRLSPSFSDFDVDMLSPIGVGRREDDCTDGSSGSNSPRRSPPLRGDWINVPHDRQGQGRESMVRLTRQTSSPLQHGANL